MILAPAMIRVLERREQKLRLEVARLSSAVAEGRKNLAAIEETIAAVERRTSDNASARFSNGARSVGELLELEQNSQSLRAGRTELETLRQRSEQALFKLSYQQRVIAKKWRKEEVRLAHVTALVRREHARAEINQFDADDEAFTERQAAAASHSGL
jgi:hypothetical protein